MCCLGNIDIRDYQETVTTGQTYRQTDGQTDARQSDPYVPPASQVTQTHVCYQINEKGHKK